MSKHGIEYELYYEDIEQNRKRASKPTIPGGRLNFLNNTARSILSTARSIFTKYRST